jgi:hypothetical protein
MNKKTRIIGVIALMIMSVIFTGNLSVFGRIHGNHTEEAFDESPLDAGTVDSVNADMLIRELIMRGAAHFLKSGADINTLSERIEMTDLEGVDYYGLYNAANNAILNMEMTAYYYRQLIAKADITPYNQTVIAELNQFDYRNFRKAKGLSKEVFDLVEQYLAAGDVRAAYRRIQDDVNHLLDRLYNIRWMIYWGYLPETETIWNLNQDNMNCHLFGQYLSRVFQEIKQE